MCRAVLGDYHMQTEDIIPFMKGEGSQTINLIDQNRLHVYKNRFELDPIDRRAPRNGLCIRSTDTAEFRELCDSYSRYVESQRVEEQKQRYQAVLSQIRERNRSPQGGVSDNVLP